MISDTLFDAIQEIRGYQQQYADMYDELRPHIEEVVKAMDALREILDTAPYDKKEIH